MELGCVPLQALACVQTRGCSRFLTELRLQSPSRLPLPEVSVQDWKVQPSNQSSWCSVEAPPCRVSSINSGVLQRGSLSRYKRYSCHSGPSEALEALGFIPHIAHSRSCATTTTFHIWSASHLQRLKLCICWRLLPQLPTPSTWLQPFCFLSLSVCSRYLIKVESYSIYPFGTCLFHLA